MTESWLIAGEDPRERLMRGVAEQAWSQASSGEVFMPPARRQVMTVLRALADHTSLQDVRRFMRDEDDLETAIGRYLHAYADLFEF